MEPGSRPTYLAWGHRGGNNTCTKREAAVRLRALWKSGRPLLFHNAKFDIDVAETFFDLKRPAYDNFFDTMLEAFLYDPNSRELGLKEQATVHLAMPPEEQDEVVKWLMKNIPALKRKKKEAKANLWLAPANIVRPYAIGDVVRTRKLHDFFFPWLRDSQVLEAYDRERRFMYVILDMERLGVPIDADRLRTSIEGADGLNWTNSLRTVEDWIVKELRRRSRRTGEINLDSNEELADALEAARLVRPGNWVMTEPTADFAQGQRSVSIENLGKAIEDPLVYGALRYRASLAHSVRTNARPWLAMAGAGSSIYPQWNQVRQASTGTTRRQIGARTGRVSSTPNAQNLANEPMRIFFDASKMQQALELAEANKEEWRALLMPPDLEGKISPLPWMRDFVIPDVPERAHLSVLGDRDYAQQELRILAHFMEGAALEIYKENPETDFHQMATDELHERYSHLAHYKRSKVKAVVLAIIYARGIPALAAQLGITIEEARQLKNAILSLFPGVKTLMDNLRRRAALEQPIRTWGGRVYYVEPPVEIIDKISKLPRLQTFEYKMINTLIQGSAADNTKEAMIRYHEDPRRQGRMLLQVHDELVMTGRREGFDAEMSLLREHMESVEFDVPMRTEGEWGPTWAQLSPYNDQR